MTPAAPSPLDSLTERWCVIGLMLVALARRVSMANKLRAQSGVPLAGMIEAQIFTSLVQLSAEIGAHADASLSPEEERALTSLKTVHALLSVLALMCRQIRCDLSAAAARLAALAGEAMRSSAPVATEPANKSAYLDSS